MPMSIWDGGHLNFVITFIYISSAVKISCEYYIGSHNPLWPLVPPTIPASLKFGSNFLYKPEQLQLWRWERWACHIAVLVFRLIAYADHCPSASSRSTSYWQWDTKLLLKLYRTFETNREV
jgi:hypothetical protein